MGFSVVNNDGEAGRGTRDGDDSTLSEKNEGAVVTPGWTCPQVMSGETNSTKTHTRWGSQQPLIPRQADLRHHHHHVKKIKINDRNEGHCRGL